jgi:hypothetical protein
MRITGISVIGGALARGSTETTPTGPAPAELDTGCGVAEAGIDVCPLPLLDDPEWPFG